MEILKKIFVIITSLILIGIVIYVIDISQKAQNERTKKSEEIVEEELKDELLPEDESAPELKDKVPGDEPVKPSPEFRTTLPETINWRSLSEEDLAFLTKEFPYGNPNPILEQAAKRIIPAVVTIQSERMFSSIPRNDDHNFFWERHRGDTLEYFQQGTGSGIIISSNGYILTNYHVIDNASEYKITLVDKREYKGKMVGGDPNTDVALIKINANNLPAAYMGNSDSVKIGEWVMAVGSPLNFRSTITAGIVSALGRDIRIIDRQYSVENFIQTDAVINPGNSGGALVNLKGEVIGVNTAIATRTGLYQGYGFAIPINLAKKIVEDVVEFGEVKRGLLGVSISPVTNLVARGVGLPQPKGVLIQSLTEGSAAEKSSLKPGDVILSVNDIEVNSVNDLQIKIAQKRPGERVKLKVWRDKSERIFFVKLGIAPASVSENIKSEERKTKPHKNLGISFRDLTKQEKNRFDTDIGVYIEDIKAGSPAREGGIYPGSIILSINDQTIENKDDLEKMISKIQKGQVVKFLVRTRRSNQETFDRILFVEKE